MTERSNNRRRSMLLATSLCILGVLATACGTGPEEEPQQAVEGGEVATDVTITPDGPPQTGGTLVYGIEAESDGYFPATNRFAPSGTLVGLTLYDPLTAFDVDLQPQPYLAESLTPNADFTSWTIRVRPDITFHDGTPLDGNAVKVFLDTLRADFLIGIAAANIDTIDLDPTDPLAVVVNMKAPWAAFPVYLTGQAGMVAAPSMATAADPGRNPVGTGPFRFVEWVPDNRLVVERNPDYWRTDANGTRLPYLDRIEFRPIVDQIARSASIEAGSVQMIHQTDAGQIARLEQQAQAGRLQIVSDRGEKEEGFVMLNTAQAPFDDIRARQALAYATDRNLYNQVLWDGQREIADGVFSEGSMWKADAPYPDYDPEAARRLVEEFEAEKGPLEFTLANSGADSRSVDLLKQMYETVGMTVQTELIEQSQFIVNAATGDFQAFVWRQFGGVDPDYDYIWWHSENSGPVGALALNFARNEDPQLDAALERGRSTLDPAIRMEAYTTVQQRINETLPYIWLDRAEWAVVATNDVRGITNGPLPDGQAANPIGGPGGFGGITFLTQTWLAP